MGLLLGGTWYRWTYSGKVTTTHYVFPHSIHAIKKHHSFSPSPTKPTIDCNDNNIMHNTALCVGVLHLALKAKVVKHEITLCTCLIIIQQFFTTLLSSILVGTAGTQVFYYYYQTTPRHLLASLSTYNNNRRVNTYTASPLFSLYSWVHIYVCAPVYASQPTNHFSFVTYSIHC